MCSYGQNVEATPSPFKLDLSPTAARFVEKNGNRVYVWGSDVSGLSKCSPTPPGGERTIETHMVSGIEVNIASDFPTPSRLGITLAYLPHRHLVALWNGTTGGGGFAPPTGGC